MNKFQERMISNYKRMLDFPVGKTENGDKILDEELYHLWVEAFRNFNKAEQYEIIQELVKFYPIFAETVNLKKN